MRTPGGVLAAQLEAAGGCQALVELKDKRVEVCAPLCRPVQLPNRCTSEPRLPLPGAPGAVRQATVLLW